MHPVVGRLHAERELQRGFSHEMGCMAQRGQAPEPVADRGWWGLGSQRAECRDGFDFVSCGHVHDGGESISETVPPSLAAAATKANLA